MAACVKRVLVICGIGTADCVQDRKQDDTRMLPGYSELEVKRLQLNTYFCVHRFGDTIAFHTNVENSSDLRKGIARAGQSRPGRYGGRTVVRSAYVGIVLNFI